MIGAQLDLFAHQAATAPGWAAPETAPDLATYDWVVINNSAGKDSMATLVHTLRLCDAAGVARSRIVVVHADLGRVEWPGARELAAAHAAALGPAVRDGPPGRPRPAGPGAHPA